MSINLPMLKNYFSSNLTYLRALNKKSQSDIGLQVNKGHTTIGNWEKGKNLPSANDLHNLSQYFDIISDDLMFKDLKNEGYDKKSDINKNGNYAGKNAGEDAGFRWITTGEKRQQKPPYSFYHSLSEKELEYELSIEIERLKDVYKDFKKLTEIIHLLNANEWLKNKFPLVPDYKIYKQDIEIEFKEMHQHLKDEKTLIVLKIVDLYQDSQEHVRQMISKLIDYIYQYSDSILINNIHTVKPG